MSEFISVIFCRRCTSRYVDISQWSDEGNAILQCRSCGYREELKGFTLGRCRVSSVELQTARDTMAKKNKYEK